MFVLVHLELNIIEKWHFSFYFRFFFLFCFFGYIEILNWHTDLFSMLRFLFIIVRNENTEQLWHKKYYDVDRNFTVQFRVKWERKFNMKNKSIVSIWENWIFFCLVDVFSSDVFWILANLLWETFSYFAHGEIFGLFWSGSEIFWWIM